MMRSRPSSPVTIFSARSSRSGDKSVRTLVSRKSSIWPTRPIVAACRPVAWTADTPNCSAGVRKDRHAVPVLLAGMPLLFGGGRSGGRELRLCDHLVQPVELGLRLSVGDVVRTVRVELDVDSE